MTDVTAKNIKLLVYTRARTREEKNLFTDFLVQIALAPSPLKGKKMGKMWRFFCNFAPLSEQGMALRKTNDVERPLNLSHFSLYVTKMVLYFANLEDYSSCKHLRNVCGTDEL